MAANIIQGGKAVLTVRLLTPSGDSYDLTNLSTMTCCFQNDDGETELTLDLTAGIVVTSQQGGKLTITLTSAQTSLLRVVTLATLEIAFSLSTDTGNNLKVQIPNAYNVIQSQC